ncbi:unnamed protein product [Thelazia callipaeda]|uniref:FIIND domain-containing protein n=1 Tax=Thelazia callipaeda TaxID=103827 RepID=A0A0N5CJU7_THECL|nr:unnamed protein product [Thelazia callipaeda]
MLMAILLLLTSFRRCILHPISVKDLVTAGASKNDTFGMPNLQRNGSESHENLVSLISKLGENSKIIHIFGNPIISKKITKHLNCEDLIAMLSIDVFQDFAEQSLKVRHQIAYIRKNNLYPKNFLRQAHCECFQNSSKPAQPFVIVFGNERLAKDSKAIFKNSPCSQVCIWSIPNGFHEIPEFKMETEMKNKMPIFYSETMLENFPFLGINARMKNVHNGFIIPSTLCGREDIYVHKDTWSEYQIPEKWNDEHLSFFVDCNVKRDAKITIFFASFIGMVETSIAHHYLECLGAYQNKLMNLTNRQVCVISQVSPGQVSLSKTAMKVIVMTFGGEGVEAITFAIKTDDKAELVQQFKTWHAQVISKMGNKQKIAFYFKTTECNDPEDCELLFNQEFPDIKLGTLCLFNNAKTSLLQSDEQFLRRSIFAIIGFQSILDFTQVST